MSGRLRVAVAGAGWWAAANHLPILMADERVDVTGVCRFGADELRRVQEVFSIPFGTECFDELMDKAPMDALVITSPHAVHAAQAGAALAAGKHVLIEKPMAMTGAEARAVEAAAEAAGRVVLVPFGWNFKPFFAEAREMMRKGAIGTLRHISAVMASPIGDLMSGENMKGTEDEMFRPDPNMWADPKTGGYGYGQLVHLLGGLFVVADIAPARVAAFTSGASGRGADLFNSVAMESAEGVTVAISGAAAVPHGNPFQIDLRFYGDEGMLLMDMERTRVALVRHDGLNRMLDLAPDAGAYECHEPVTRFVDLCFEAEADNPADATIGRKTIEVVDAMHRSAREGRIVDAREDLR